MARLGALAPCAFLISCAAAPTAEAPPAKAASPAPTEDVSGGVTEADLALTLGDPVRAMAILRAVPAEDSTYSYAQELLEDAKADTGAVIQDWLREVDTLIAVNRYRAARARCEYLLEKFPLDDKTQESVKERLAAVERAAEEAKTQLDDAEKQARDLLLSNDMASALVTLRGGLDLAWELDASRALAWERIIALTNMRYQEAIAEGRANKPSETIVRRRRRRKPSIASASASAPAAPAEPAPPPPDPEELKRKQEIASLLAEAAQAVERSAHFRAIQAYEKVIAMEAQNPKALKALAALGPKRGELIEEYLSKANQHYVRQDLEGAVPYYKKVLALDPNHKGALEGLRMHENLQKIKGRKRR